VILETKGILEITVNNLKINKMKVQGTGFTYWLNKQKLQDFDSWEKAIKKLNVETEVRGLELHAKTVEK